ncbi:MAG: 4Fe-4S binding protein [Alphaproteobacteria bacterium]|nr:4Fe-4S binding protein [Alphaproteobacteria bacterium]
MGIERALASLVLAAGIIAGLVASALGEDPISPDVANWYNPDLGAEWLTMERVQRLFPEATKVTPLEGEALSAVVMKDGTPLGYVFDTADKSRSLGFSLQPFNIAIGLGLDGILTGIDVVEQHEPIIDLIMLQKLVTPFTAQYAGLDIRRPWRVALTRVEEEGNLDGISSATISAVLFNEAVLDSARKVARARGLRLNDEPAVDLIAYDPATLSELIADGSIARLTINESDLAETPVGYPALAPLSDQVGGEHLDDTTVIELLVAPVHPPTIGRNLLGQGRYNLFVSGRDPRDLTLLLMGAGPYLFDPQKLHADGVLDRARVVQGGQVFALDRGQYRYINFLPDRSGPKFAQMGLFWIKREQGIKPLEPFRVELDVVARNGEDRVTFAVDYSLDARYIVEPTGVAVASGDSGPAWLATWRMQGSNIAILCVLLLALTAILFGMQWLTRRPQLFSAVRIAYLAVVVAWLGWQVGAQVTIINLLTWLQTIIGGGSPEVVLSDPLIAVLMAFVVVSFVIWGRGVFCGWLCPFGVMQELLTKAARRLGIQEVGLSYRAHQLLWPVKYVILAVLVGLSFYSMTTAGTAAEVEPFKTAISLRFARDWPYVIYAVTLLAIGLFTERFFCRFLCPVGAAMVLGGKLRLRPLVFLKRYAECGSPCQLCTRRCPIQAISPDGHIVMDECFYCLDCQVLYNDAHQCPLLAQQRKQRERETLDEPVTAQ